ncbi:hypothetical protein RhiirA5_483970, partial [Rhizophagus irregularis]
RYRTVGNNDGSKLGSPPSNRYPPSRLEFEKQLKKDREMFIRSAKQLIAKYHALDKKNKCMQNDLDHSHEENERMQNSMNQFIPLSKQLNGLNNKLVSQITCERKSHADLNAKQLKEIESLKSEINLKDSEITSFEEFYITRPETKFRKTGFCEMGIAKIGNDRHTRASHDNS